MYETPVAELVELDVNDVLRTSGGNGEDNTPDDDL